jgi:hypothetical protein
MQCKSIKIVSVELRSMATVRNYGEKGTSCRLVYQELKIDEVKLAPTAKVAFFD